MAVVIRLSRWGTNKKPYYRVVAADEDFPRDGRYLEVLGTYNPKNADKKGLLKKDRIEYWVSKGARPSKAVVHIIRRSGS